MSFKNETVSSFLDALASQASTPGGGSAAAVMGSMGAALVSMVCNLTIGKPKYAPVEAEVKALLARAEGLRAALLDAMADDVRVFDAVMAAYGLPKDDDAQKAARSAAIQSALREATDVPLACARLAAEVIGLCRATAEQGNVNVVSDAGVAVLAAHAAVRSAALNVYINIGGIKDAEFAGSRREAIEALLADTARETEAVFELVKAKLSGH
ncbi:MAG TPA: methenyltetrahydrofolate cyclohydrolase [Gammaproteobacteria bacterium]|nr:methenyltetrahydrofolate cyclohydrolase [Gammaproteobacteria bacterium]